MTKKTAAMPISTIVLALTALATGLIAGLFYAYSCSVNPGLGAVGDKEYLSAMQSINVAILNPVFFATFMGTVALLPLSTWLSYAQPIPLRFWLLLAASAIYIVGTFGVTMAGNVPLNNALAVVDISASADELLKHRAAFEIPWNRLHTIRTIAVVAAFTLVIAACIKGQE